MPPKGIGSGPKKSKKTRTERGPQGLPTQASSPQRSGPPPRQARPAPVQQPGPIRRVESRRIERHKRTPIFKRRQADTRRERQAEQTAAHADAVNDALSALNQPEGPSTLQKALRLAVSLSPAAQGQLATRRALRSTPTGRDIDRELSGQGDVAKTVAKFAKLIADNQTVTATGTGSIAGSATSGGRSQIASARPIKPPKGVQRFTEDLVNFPAQAIPSLYVPGAAAIEAVGGDTERANQVIEDFKEQDPLYALLTGDFKEAGERAAEHPGFTALELLGAKGTIGRGMGTTARVGGALGSDTLKNLGSVHTRPNATRPGTSLAEERRYSRDLITKGFQKGSDRRKARRAESLRKQADEVEPRDAALAVDLRRKANDVDPEFMSDKAIGKRVDLTEQQNYMRTRREVGEVDKLVSEIIDESGDPGAGLNLTAQGIARADPTDLIKYRDELASAYQRLDDPAKKAANVELRNAIDDTLTKARGRKGSDLMPRIEAAAQRFSNEIDKPLDAKLEDLKMIAPERAERAKVIPPAARRLNARVDEQLGLVIDGPDGPKKVTREDLEGAGIDVDALSYVSQSPNARSAGAYYRSSAREPTISGARRTERPTVEGTFDATPESLRARAMKAQNIATAADNFRRSIGEAAVRNPKDGKAEFARRQDAENAARSLNQSTGAEYKVVNVIPWSASRKQMEAIVERMGDADDPRMVESFREAFSAGLKGQGPDGPFAVVPRAWADRAEQHLKVLGPGDADRALRAMRSMFTGTVLAVSPGPTVGNAVEATFRSIINRAGPRSFITAKKVLQALADEDPELARALKDRAVPGGKIRLATQRKHFDPKMLNEGTARRWAARWQAAKLAPGAKQGVGAWRLWQHFVFDQINGRMEEFFQTAQLGKAIRDSGFMDDRIMKTSNAAARQAADGLKNTPAQARMAMDVYDSYGKYAGFSPTGRKMIAEYTPFAAWWLSSVNFLTRVLPRDHPTLLAVIAASEQLTEEWRKSEGMDLFINGDGKLPGWLQGTLAVSGVGRVQASRMTPFSVGTDPLGAASGAVLPQFSTTLNAFQGMDWKNQKLRHEDGSEFNELDKMLYAIKEMGKSTIPAIAVPDRAAKYIADPDALLNPFRIKTKVDSAQGGKPSRMEELLEKRADKIQSKGQDRMQELLEKRAERLGN